MPEPHTAGLDTLPPVRTVAELFRVAMAVKGEAARRYRQLAAHMAEADRADLAALFRDLEAQEHAREAGIDRWARGLGIDPARGPDFRWRSPEGLTAEDIAEAGGEALMTPEGALDLAVHNAQRAFSCFVRIATEAEAAEVRDHAEHMAREEISRIARLRLERRRAARRRLAEWEGPRAFEDAASLEGWLQDHESESAARLARIARGCRALQAEAAVPRLHPGDGASAEPASGGAARTLAELRGEAEGALRETERAYETLLRTIERAPDEAVVTLAQDHAERVLKRLVALSDLRAGLLGHARGGD